LFGISKQEKFEKISIDFMNFITQHEVASIVERYPRHFRDDFKSSNEAGKIVYGREWPNAQHAQGLLLDILNSKMWWLIKFHQAVFGVKKYHLEAFKADKIQRDHLMGQKKLFVHELLYFHLLFGEAAIKILSENDFPKHFLERFEQFKTMEVPSQGDDLVTLQKWCQLPEEVRLATLS